MWSPRSSTLAPASRRSIRSVRNPSDRTCTRASLWPTKRGRLLVVVIPIHDDNPVRRRPIVTYLLIALNVIVFLSEPVVSQIGVGRQGVQQACTQQAYFDKWAAIPKEVTSGKPLPPHQYVIETDVGSVPCPITNDRNKKPYLSVLYSMFLHGGWLHLLGNMLFLYVFGNNVEDVFGRLKYLLFYLFCGY